MSPPEESRTGSSLSPEVEPETGGGACRRSLVGREGAKLQPSLPYCKLQDMATSYILDGLSLWVGVERVVAVLTFSILYPTWQRELLLGK